MRAAVGIQGKGVEGALVCQQLRLHDGGFHPPIRTYDGKPHWHLYGGEMRFHMDGE